MASVAVRSKAVVLLLFIHCLLFLGFVLDIRYAVYCVLPSFAIIWLGKRELVALSLWSSESHILLSLKVPWVGL